MEPTLQQYETIQRYLDGGMSPEEEKRYEDELNNNAELKSYLDFERQLRQNTASLHQKKSIPEITTDREDNFDDAPFIKNLIEQAGKEWKKEKELTAIPVLPLTTHKPQDKLKVRKGVIISIKPWVAFAVAASLIIAIVTIIWVVSKDTGTTQIAGNGGDSQVIKKGNDTSGQLPDSLKQIQPIKEELNFASIFRKAFKKDDVPVEKPQLLAEALTDYRDADYEALQNLQLADFPVRGDLPVNNINSHQNVKELGHYYKGIAFIETGKDRQAIENLQWVIDSAANNVLVAKSQWYLALINVKKGNTDTAIGLLTIVAKNKNAAPFNRRAMEMMRVLKPNK